MAHARRNWCSLAPPQAARASDDNGGAPRTLANHSLSDVLQRRDQTVYAGLGQALFLSIKLDQKSLAVLGQVQRNVAAPAEVNLLGINVLHAKALRNKVVILVEFGRSIVTVGETFYSRDILAAELSTFLVDIDVDRLAKVAPRRAPREAPVFWTTISEIGGTCL